MPQCVTGSDLPLPVGGLLNKPSSRVLQSASTRPFSADQVVDQPAPRSAAAPKVTPSWAAHRLINRRWMMRYCEHRINRLTSFQRETRGEYRRRVTLERSPRVRAVPADERRTRKSRQQHCHRSRIVTPAHKTRVTVAEQPQNACTRKSGYIPGVPVPGGTVPKLLISGNVPVSPMPEGSTFQCSSSGVPVRRRQPFRLPEQAAPASRAHYVSIVGAARREDTPCRVRQCSRS